MNSPAPIVADGWISTPVTERTTAAIVRGTTGTPASCSAWATRWASSAWTPGHAARISPGPTPRAAGSRSRAARTSRVTSLTTLESAPVPNIARRMLRGEERRRDVSLARVGQDRHDPRPARLRAARHLERGVQRRAAGDAGQDALGPRQRAGALDRILVADGDDLVEQVALEHGRHEARADPLDAMRPGPAAAQHRRARGLDGDDPAVLVVVLEDLAR